jgi:hypothetical protein
MLPRMLRDLSEAATAVRRFKNRGQALSVKTWLSCHWYYRAAVAHRSYRLHLACAAGDRALGDEPRRQINELAFRNS